MISSDLFFILNWWLIFFIFGLFFLPLTFSIFSDFFDRGYIFSKIIGVIIVSYLLFVFGIIHLFKFTNIISVFLLFLSGLFNYIFYFFFKKQTIKNLFGKWKIFLLEELFFLLSLFFWSSIRSFQPDIHGLEKFMDFGFINSILRTDYFPPKDMWFPPFSINYYYFGHLTTAVLTKISGIPSQITYNLMLSTIFALCFSMSFSIGSQLINILYKKSEKQFLSLLSWIKIISGGLLTAGLVSLGGNLHTIYTLFTPYQNENPVPFWDLIFSLSTFPNSYWYPNATRFIHNTIHEFPIYSFVVSDLHGHVLDIPIVLTVIAVLLNFFISQKKLGIKLIVLLSFLISINYMTNAWDGIIYILLSFAVLTFVFVRNKIKLRKPLNFLEILYDLLPYFGVLITGFIIFTFPFNIFFKPFASGIGILCAPKFLTDTQKIGPFLFEADHCQRSPLWQLSILYGFFYFWIFAFLIFLLSKTKKIKKSVTQIKDSDFFVIILIIVSTFLIILPEFVYVKDIYPAHYRANTMFKLVYQSFIMLSISSGYIFVRIIKSLKINKKISSILFSSIFLLVSIFLFSLVFIYPYFAVFSYYGNLENKFGLDGTNYLKNLYPYDHEAINWINKNIKGQPILLESQGDSYTDYERISVNTGLPTILGWTVHEWLWRGTYDIPAPRIPEVQTLYETKDLKTAKELIKKYKVSYIYIGQMEKQKYPNLYEEKFNKIGNIIYKNPEVKIYRINFF